MKRIAALLLVLCLALGAVWAAAEGELPADIRGTVSDGIYTNERLGFGFRAEGWVFLTQEAMDENLERNSRAMGRDFRETSVNVSTVVLSANLPGYRDCISVMAFDLGEDAPFYEALGEEGIMEATRDAYRENLEAGWTLRSFGMEDISVNGYELPCILAEVSDSNPWYMMQFALVRTCFVSENWLVVMEAAADTPEAALEALRHIFWL